MKLKTLKTITAVTATALAIGNAKAGATVGDFADHKYHGGAKHTIYLGKLRDVETSGSPATGGGYYAAQGYVGASPGPGEIGYIYPSQGAAARAGDLGGRFAKDNELGHKVLSTIGHFFTGSLGHKFE